MKHYVIYFKENHVSYPEQACEQRTIVIAESKEDAISQLLTEVSNIYIIEVIEMNSNGQ